jgi:hypothetical protein
VAALSRADHVPVSAILNSFAYDLVATAGIAMLPLRRFWRRKRAAERWERLLEPVDSPREIAGPAALDSLWCLEHHTRVHSSVTDRCSVPFESLWRVRHELCQRQLPPEARPFFFQARVSSRGSRIPSVDRPV